MTSDEERRGAGKTAELLRSAVERVARQEADRVRRYTRKDAYLMVWGVVYLAFGFVVAHRISQYVLTHDRPLVGQLVLQYGFMLAGSVSLVAATLKTNRLHAVAFTFLSGLAAGEAFWNATAARSPVAWLAAVLWVGVSTAQYIVAGWPDTPRKRLQ